MYSPLHVDSLEVDGEGSIGYPRQQVAPDPGHLKCRHTLRRRQLVPNRQQDARENLSIGDMGGKRQGDVEEARETRGLWKSHFEVYKCLIRTSCI